MVKTKIQSLQDDAAITVDDFLISAPADGGTAKKAPVSKLVELTDTLYPEKEATELGVELAIEHIADDQNPHSTTKFQVGLGNVTNVDATLRSNHAGTQSADTITDGTINKAFTASERQAIINNTASVSANTTSINGLANGTVNVNPTDIPGTTDGVPANVTTVAPLVAGTYTSFDAIVVSSGDLNSGSVQLRKAGGVWTKIIIPVPLTDYYNKSGVDRLLFPNYLKSKTSQSYTTDELTIISAIPALDLKVLDADKADDWRITFVATVATSGTTFNYNVRVRNITKSENYDIVDDDALNTATLNGVKHYSGTKDQNSKTISFSIGVDWSKLPVGQTFQYFNNSGNLKLNVGYNTISASLDEKQQALTARVTTNETSLVPLAGIPARTQLIETALSAYVSQSVSAVTGSYMNSSGIITTSSGFKYFTFAANDFDKIKASSIVSGAPVWLAIYKNSGGTVLGTEQQGTGGVDTVFTDFLLTIPYGTTSITINSKTSGTIAVKKLTIQPVATAADVISNAAKIAEVRDPLLAFNTITTTITTGGYISQANNFAASSSYKYMNFSVVDTDRIKITTVINGNPLRAAIFLSSTDSVLGTYQNGTNSVDTAVNDVELTLPAGTTSITVNAKSTATIVIKKYGVREIPTATDIAFLQEQFDVPNSQYKGTTGHFSGTSITDTGSNINPPIPERVGVKLGMTVNNQAKGSSVARIGKADGTWTGVAWQNIAYAYAHTIAEKQDLIDNWSTYRTMFTADPSAVVPESIPVTLTDDQKATILSCSYENRLVPYLAGSDWFFIEHGRNDYFLDATNFVTSYGATLAPGDPGYLSTTKWNRNTYKGAMSFIFEVILKVKPHGRIILIEHYENVRDPLIVQAQEALANEWCLPRVRLYEKTMFSNQVLTGETDAIIKKYFGDGIHPSNDSTGYSSDLVASIIAREVLSIF